ncbi:hypothetical protein RUND412_005802 [Rhizina undulata]
MTNATEIAKEVVKNELKQALASRKSRGRPVKAESWVQLYLRELQENPLRTKMFTSGTLAALQEILASMIAHDKGKHFGYFTPRVPKMLAYGSLISAPLGHILVMLLQKAFAGRTSTKSKILQIIVSNLIVSPIQNSVYLACMAYIAGAKQTHQITDTVKANFFSVMKVSWCTSPIALIIAQKFLPPHAWVPFFNLVAFVIGTYINAKTKKATKEAIQQKKRNAKKTSHDRRDDDRR